MARPVKRPNILLITCDQWRGDCLSAVGHAVVKTPNADALAAEGVLFGRHYAGAAPCAPARACLYTGLYQMTNRVCRNGTPLDARHGNIALFARRQGYDPTLFGYTDTGPDPRTHAAGDPRLRTYEGVLPGFTARQLLPEHQRQWISWLEGRGVRSGAAYPGIHRPTGATSRRIGNAPPVYSRDETPAAFLAGEFVRWLAEQDRGWFAHISFISPHPPFVAPAPYDKMYDPDLCGGFRRAARKKDERDIHPYVGYALARQDIGDFVVGARGKVSDRRESEFRQLRATYYGMISEVDSQLGRIWASLKAHGAWDDTIVILTSDHAEMMGDHRMLGKGGFFDGSYHIPLIIRDPRSRKGAGRRLDVFTEAVDVLPTVLDLCGTAIPAHLDGHSLKPFLAGTAAAGWRDAAHWEFDFRSIAKQTAETHFGIASRQCNLAVLRTRTLKYVHFGGGLPPVMFDLASDPMENANVADEPAYRLRRVEMAEQLLAWRSEHLDQSLALSELTEHGITGQFHAMP